MKDLVYSNVTGRTYDIKDVVRIINIQQVIAYLKNGVELIDLYPSIDMYTEKPILVFIFNRKDSRDAYDAWCKHELN